LGELIAEADDPHLRAARQRASVTKSAVTFGSVSLRRDARARIRGFASPCYDRSWRRDRFDSGLDVSEKTVGEVQHDRVELN
jgi:hypothetical protein